MSERLEWEPVPIRKHESGLRIQAQTVPGVKMLQKHVVALPVCCPVSQNPREGSTLTVMYRPEAWVLEVYSLARVVDRFRGGFPGRGRYQPERNMEGMVRLLAQMAADALGVRVTVRAHLVLDAGLMRLYGRAEPCATT
jgi:7-cyano-7-deazaguanine reductase